ARKLGDLNFARSVSKSPINQTLDLTKTCQKPDREGGLTLDPRITCGEGGWLRAMLYAMSSGITRVHNDSAQCRLTSHGCRSERQSQMLILSLNRCSIHFTKQASNSV